MRVCPVLRFPLLLAVSAACLLSGPAAAVPAAGPKILVVVHLREPDFVVNEMKYRVLWNEGEVKKIPLTDYDFRVAFTDELLNALAGDSRAEWIAATGKEGIDVLSVWEKKKPVPADLDADRLLLVDISQYGAFVADLAADKFWLMLRMKLTDKSGSKKIWEKRLNERVDLPGKVAELQADNQKGLKDGVNKMVEGICKKVLAEMKKVRL